MAGFAGAPRLWSRLAFVSSVNSLDDDYAVYSQVFAFNYRYVGAPLAEMVLRPDHLRFAFATVDWTTYTQPEVRARQYQIGQSVEGEDVSFPKLWDSYGNSQPASGLAPVPPAGNPHPVWGMNGYSVPPTGAHADAPRYSGEYADDGSVFASLLYVATDPTKVYLSVTTSAGVATSRKLLGIVHRPDARGWMSAKMVVFSATNIWIFHRDVVGGLGRLMLSVWDGTQVAGTTQLDLGEYGILSFEAVRDGAKVVLVYSLIDESNPYTTGGDVNTRSFVRVLDTATQSLSALLHTSPVLYWPTPPDAWQRVAASIPGDRLPANRPFSFKGDTYLVHAYPGGALVVYTYPPGNPEAVSLLKWGFVQGLSASPPGESYLLWQSIGSSESLGRITGIEYDPESDTAMLVTMRPERAEALESLGVPPDVERLYVVRHWQPLDTPAWEYHADLLDELPSYVYEPGDSSAALEREDVIGYVPSRYGKAAESLLFAQPRKQEYGIRTPCLQILRMQNWRTPMEHTSEVPIALSASVAVSGARDLFSSVQVGEGLEVDVSGGRPRAASWATSWGASVDKSVSGEVVILLQPDIQITGTLPLTHNAGAQISLGDDMVRVAGVVETQMLLEYRHVAMGVSFLEEFQGYMNEERAAVWGRPPVSLMGSTPLSLDVLTNQDIAQRHSDNMAAARWYAHGAAVFPEGWRTAHERVLLVSNLGAENLLYAADMYSLGAPLPTPYELWTAWRNSPPHYANMMLDWEAYGAGTTQYIFSTLALRLGANPLYDGGGPPWDDYPIVELDPGFSGHPWSSTVYATNNFLLIKEAYVEATLIEQWARAELQALLLEHYWQRSSLQKVAASHDSRYSLTVGAAHTAPYGGTVVAVLDVGSTHSVAADHVAAYVPTIRVGVAQLASSYDLQKLSAASQLDLVWADRVAALLDAPYDDAYTARAALESRYEDAPRLRTVVIADYGDTPRVVAALPADYGETPRVVVALPADYGPLARVAAETSLPYGAVPVVRASLDAPYAEPLTARTHHQLTYVVQRRVAAALALASPLGSPVRASHAAEYGMLLRNPTSRIHTAEYVLEEVLWHVPSSPYSVARLNGQEMEVEDGYVSCDFDSPGYTFSCTVPDVGFVRGARQGDALTVVFEGTVYAFFVSEIAYSAEEGSAADKVTLGGLSPVYLLDAPYADTETYAPEGTRSFSSIIQEVLGVPVDFSRHIDWLVPYGRAQSSSQTPLAAAKGFLEPVGSRLLSEPSGSLYVLPRYPVGFDALPSGAQAHTFEKDQNLFTRASSYEYARGYNRFRVRDTEASFADMIEFDQVTGIASVYVSPYRATWRLGCTTTPGILLDSLGETTELHEEVWDFSAGTATAKYPILGLVSVDWITDSLGGLSFDPYSTKVTAPTAVNFGYGLARVAYQAKCSKFMLTSSAPIEATQLIIVEQ